MNDDILNEVGRFRIYHKASISEEFFPASADEHESRRPYSRSNSFLNFHGMRRPEVLDFYMAIKRKVKKALKKGGCNGGNWEQLLDTREKEFFNFLHFTGQDGGYTNSGVLDYVDRALEYLKR